jgi:uncharacterized protein YceH (UPF0502 family)
MSEAAPPAPSWSPLDPAECRVLGVLIEKQKTTPEYYPMTVAAIVTGCNQKSNRHPITNYDADDVEDTLQALRKKGVAIMIEGLGRVPKWKHAAYDWLGLKGKLVELSVLAELLLRGPQTEGELRTRASRMNDIPDLPALQEVLNHLKERGLVVQLSPPGQKRGVIVSHTLYPPAELARLRDSWGQEIAEGDSEPSASSSHSSRSGLAQEVEALKAQLARLQAQVNALANELHELKTGLGA